MKRWLGLLSPQSPDLSLHSLPRKIIGTPGTLSSGVTNVVNASGTYLAPPLASALTDPPQRFAVRNDGQSNLILQLPDGTTGNVLNLTLYPGMARVYRQISTNGYGLEDGIPFSVLRSQFAPATTPITVSLAQNLQAAASGTTDVLSMDLGVGTWLIAGSFLLQCPNANMSGAVLLNTAAGTIAGPASTTVRSGGNPFQITIPLSGVVVVVTAPGSVIFRFTNGATSAATLFPSGTAFTAIRIAP